VLPVLYQWFEQGKKNSPKTRKPGFLKMKTKKVLPILLFLFAGNVFAQTPINLQSAIDTAISNSFEIQSAKLKTLAALKLEGSAVDLPPTSVVIEYGKINSPYTDAGASARQLFSFPVVYKRQRQLLMAETEISKLNEAQIKWQLQKEISKLFYEILLLQEKKKLLLQADSLFQSSLQKQEQRFEAGDINVLEKTAAETQRLQIAAQLQQLNTDLAGLQTAFSSLLNSGTTYTAESVNPKAVLQSLPDISSIANLPSIQISKQQQQVAEKVIDVQKNALLPQPSLGYTNQSIRGLHSYNGIEKNYSFSNRFSSVEVGMNIPIFNKAAKSKIAAAQRQSEAAQKEVREKERQQQTILQQLWLQYKNNEQQLQFYQQALQQAKLLREHSTLQLNSGETGYLQWMQLINQSIQLEAGYFEALHNWNATVIELNAFSNH
jgi:cobalt-zinc-cadmium resistance protein CzcA